MKYAKFNIMSLQGLSYAFFCVVPWRLNFICRRFGTLYLFHLHMKMEQAECSEIQEPANYTEESIKRSEGGESLKSRESSNFFPHDSAFLHLQLLLCWRDFCVGTSNI